MERKCNYYLPLRNRPFDFFFIVAFSAFFVTSMIADMIPTLLGANKITADHPNMIVRANYWYASNCDPLFLNPPFWMRMVTGLSAFVYAPFYLVLVAAFIQGWHRIRIPAIIYGSLISVITGVIVFGVEFFGEPEYQTTNPKMFLSFNLPYVVVPIILIIRMRHHHPFYYPF